jgi:hypothetical protein
VSAPSTLIALAVLVVAVLPGSVYTWAFERQAGAYGVTFTDRVLRFLGISLLFHLLLAWPEYALYRLLVGRRDGQAPLLVAEFALLWVGLLVFTTVPLAVGAVVGSLYSTRTTRQGWSRLRRRWLTAVDRSRAVPTRDASAPTLEKKGGYSGGKPASAMRPPVRTPAAGHGRPDDSNSNGARGR